MAAPASVPQLMPFIDRLALPEAIRPRHEQQAEVGTVTLELLNVRQRLHSAFAAGTNLWTYDGSYPGPSIEVRRGERVRVFWRNSVNALAPLTSITTADAGNLGSILHAGIDSDACMENSLLPDVSQITEYDNNQQAGQLWYHPAGNDTISFNVFSGLIGLWFIRDEFDDKLIQSLVATRPHPEDVVLPQNVTSSTSLSHVVEIPLLIQDRNFDTGDHTSSGRLVYEVDERTREFFGPYTLVNGIVWPRADISALPYRLRILNGSSSRVYRLRLLDDQDQSVPYQLIGADTGLLETPVPSGGEDLVIAPAARADIVIDFAPYVNRRLTWLNVAPAPYKGPAVTVDPWSPDPDTHPNLHVMQFSVGPAVRHANSWRPPCPTFNSRKA